MMRVYLVLGIWCVCNIASLGALALPQWSADERSRLERGEIIPGVSLLIESEDASPLVEPGNKPEEEVPELPAPEPAYDPRIIPPDHWVTYFEKFPKNYLVDPQRLLTMQETQDREGFLNYHAEDSDITIRLYLFDAQQQIPEAHSLGELVSER